MSLVAASDHRLGWQTVAGGVLLGLGALLNGGCYLGSITYLGSGNSNFLFTLVGIALSLRLADPSSGLYPRAAHGTARTMGHG